LYNTGDKIAMPRQDYGRFAESYWESPIVKEVFKELEAIKPEIIEEWKRIARIYAPSGKEGPRAEYLTGKFREYDIENAHIDCHGNAVALIEKGEGPTVAFLATMDDLATVADLVKTWDKPIEERDGRLMGPGTNIGSICAAGLGLARLFILPEVNFDGRIYIVGVTQEETGLAGTKGFIGDHPGELDYIVDMMGGAGRMSYGALGIHWFKVHYKGPRAHTLRGPGTNVTKGVAKSVTRIFSLELPPDSFLNISMLGAGKVYNHRSDDGWHSVDLRSVDNDALKGVKDEILGIAEETAKEEELEWWIEPFSETPASQIPGARESKLVRVAEEVTRLMGIEPSLSNRGSCNMNAGVAVGISTISTGGDRGGGRDSQEEYANIEPAMAGIRLNFLIGYILTSGKLI
jgi:acetylornithine deacetylase/succinyl-diaminopimelate desuccinylase-like protein